MTATVSNLRSDGELRRFAAHGQARLAHAGGMALLCGEFEPGWRWSTDVAPIAGTASCRVRHLGYVIEGRMAVRMDDGTEIEIGPGDLFDIPAGHDALVLGKKRAVLIDVSPDATRYARQPGIAEVVDPYIGLVRQGYDAFNAGDVATLSRLMSRDVRQHVPGVSQIAGEYKGLDAVLAFYGRLGELTDGTMRAALIDVHGDGHGHVLALHQISATRNDRTLVARGSILFTFMGERATDLLEMSADQAAVDAFFA
jgi:ketosteroid isomerase-like protein